MIHAFSQVNIHNASSPHLCPPPPPPPTLPHRLSVTPLHRYTVTLPHHVPTSLPASSPHPLHCHTVSVTPSHRYTVTLPHHVPCHNQRLTRFASICRKTTLPSSGPRRNRNCCFPLHAVECCCRRPRSNRALPPPPLCHTLSSHKFNMRLPLVDR